MGWGRIARTLDAAGSSPGSRLRDAWARARDPEAKDSACDAFWQDTVDATIASAAREAGPECKDALVRRLARAQTPQAGLLAPTAPPQHNEAVNPRAVTGATRQGASDVAPATYPSCRADIIKSGGQVQERWVDSVDLPYDCMLICPETEPAARSWVAWHTSRMQLAVASQFFANMVAAIPVGESQKSEWVLPYPGATAERMGTLLGALHNRQSTPRDCIEMAALVDYLEPRPNGPWADVDASCFANFVATPLQANKVVHTIERLSRLGPGLTRWLDHVAAFVATSSAAQKAVLALGPSDFAALIDSPSLSLPEERIVELALAWAKRHRPRSQTPAEYCVSCNLVPRIRWVALSYDTLWAQQGMFTAAQFGELMRTKGRELGETAGNVTAPLSRSFFGRSPRLSDPSAIEELQLVDSPHEDNFEVTWNVPNFIAAVSESTGTYSPLFHAARHGWKLQVGKTGVYVTLLEGAAIKATMKWHIVSQRPNVTHKDFSSISRVWQLTTDTPQLADAGLGWGTHWTTLNMEETIYLSNSPFLTPSGTCQIFVQCNYALAR